MFAVLKVVVRVLVAMGTGYEASFAKRTCTPHTLLLDDNDNNTNGDDNYYNSNSSNNMFL